MKSNTRPHLMFLIFVPVMLTGLKSGEFSKSMVCEIELPTGGTWSGQSNWGVAGDISNTQITISKTDTNTYEISDYSGGLIKANGHTDDNKITITLTCDNQVEAGDFNTPFGDCIITGGTWDAENKKLTLNWKLPKSGVDETTIFTFNL